jgi:formate dehydrogenase subunit gamma
MSAAAKTFMKPDRNWDRTAILAIASRQSAKPGALMLVLREIQDRFGFIPPDCVPTIAQALNLSRAEVHGVISFYHDFRAKPAGRHLLRVCRAESCQAMGAVELLSHIKKRTGIGLGETSEDGTFTLEPVYCLGNCACSPAIVIDGELHGRVTADAFDHLIAGLRE